MLSWQIFHQLFLRYASLWHSCFLLILSSLSMHLDWPGNLGKWSTDALIVAGWRRFFFCLIVLPHVFVDFFVGSCQWAGVYTHVNRLFVEIACILLACLRSSKTIFFEICRTWPKRYLITSQTRVKCVSRIHHRTILSKTMQDYVQFMHQRSLAWLPRYRAKTLILKPEGRSSNRFFFVWKRVENEMFWHNFGKAVSL